MSDPLRGDILPQFLSHPLQMVYRQGINTSFIAKHQDSHHSGQEPEYKAKVVTRTRDCLSRQVREAVLIRRSDKNILNGKSEWHQPALFRVQQEIEQG